MQDLVFAEIRYRMIARRCSGRTPWLGVLFVISQTIAAKLGEVNSARDALDEICNRGGILNLEHVNGDLNGQTLGGSE